MNLEKAVRDALGALNTAQTFIGHPNSNVRQVILEAYVSLEKALAQQATPLQRFISTEQDHPEDRYAHSQMPDVKEGQCQYCGNFDPPAQQEKQSSSVFLQNLHYFFGQTDGTYKWPEGSVGDLLRQAKIEIEQKEKPAPIEGVVIRDGSPTLLMTKDGSLPTDQRLYTEPPPRREWVGLTDEQIRSIKESFCDEPIFPISLARKIEDKLKELNT